MVVKYFTQGSFLTPPQEKPWIEICLSSGASVRSTIIQPSVKGFSGFLL